MRVEISPERFSLFSISADYLKAVECNKKQTKNIEKKRLKYNNDSTKMFLAEEIIKGASHSGVGCVDAVTIIGAKSGMGGHGSHSVPVCCVHFQIRPFGKSIK